MTKHELLQYLSERKWVTPNDIARKFYLTPTGIFSLLEILRVSGFVQRNRFKTEKGTSNYYYSLTSKGLNKLYYFDQAGCKKPDCFCA